MDFRISLLGFAVGLLVGLTGMGGGAVMTPLLVLVVRVAPTLAIGTDLAYASVTKLVGAWQHWRQGTVEVKLAGYLALGSVPASLAGVALLEAVRSTYGTEVERFLSHILAAVLLLVALSLLVRVILGSDERQVCGWSGRLSRYRPLFTALLGAAGGLMVGLTSIGGGTLIMALLVLVYPLSADQLIGTDIFQAAFLTGAAALAHATVGDVDWALAGQLLVGSVPGVLLGSRLVFKTTKRALRLVLAGSLLALGVRLMS